MQFVRAPRDSSAVHVRKRRKNLRQQRPQVYAGNTTARCQLGVMANHEVKKTYDVGLGPKSCRHTMLLDRSCDWPKRINDDPNCAFSLPTEQSLPPKPPPCGTDILRTFDRQA